MPKYSSGEELCFSFREIEEQDFPSIPHKCTYFNWQHEAYVEDGSRVFMCHFPGKDDCALGLISLIPYQLPDNRGFIEIYMIESERNVGLRLVGTHLVAWACKLGLEWFGEDSYYVMAVPKHKTAVTFFEKIGAKLGDSGDMILLPDAAKRLIEICKL